MGTECSKSLGCRGSSTLEDGRKINRIYIDLILILSEGLDLNILLRLVKKNSMTFKAQNKRLESSIGTSFPNSFYNFE